MTVARVLIAAVCALAAGVAVEQVKAKSFCAAGSGASDPYALHRCEARA